MGVPVATGAYICTFIFVTVPFMASVFNSEYALKSQYDTSIYLQNLTQWGGALLELSQFGDINESKKKIKDAVSKLDEALVMNLVKHEGLWCLGNPHNANGFLTLDYDEAQIQFNRASELSRERLLNSYKASDLHNEIHKQGMFNQSQQSVGGRSTVSSNPKIVNEFGSCGIDKDYVHHLVNLARMHLGDDLILGNRSTTSPRSFESIEEYLRVFQPLLFEECRAELYSTWEELTETSSKNSHTMRQERGWYDVVLLPKMILDGNLKRGSCICSANSKSHCQQS
ncbi:hypothetical protein L1887_21120 [Cichorium endivia]|nr:hypothetical protein L1887_21120 [Cichorium endivia]